MGILKKADGDLTVATIAVRNALAPKFDGMQVMVLDASAIAELGSGRALFQWSTAANDWLLLWAEAFPILQTMASVNDHESRLDALESSGSGGDFVAITENGKTGYGTSYRAANPNNYGNIGTQAVDLSYNSGDSTTRGATGDYSTAIGSSCTASGSCSTAIGYYCTTSGSYSTAIGYFCTASVIGSTAMGRSCMASGSGSTAMGAFCTASGTGSTAMGGRCTASGSYSTAMGFYADTNSIKSKLAIGASTTLGKNQTGFITLGNVTADGTSKTLTSDQSTAATSNQLILPNNAAQAFRGLVVANATNMAASWEITGLIRRGANASDTVLVGSAVTKMYGDAGLDACTVALVVDTTNGGVSVNVTGVAATSIQWTCSIWTAEAI